MSDLKNSETKSNTVNTNEAPTALQNTEVVEDMTDNKAQTVASAETQTQEKTSQEVQASAPVAESQNGQNDLNTQSAQDNKETQGEKDGEHVKTEAELKEEKQQRMRRNFRILALCVAAYYFISAGFSWYEESQRESEAQIAAITNTLSDPKAFRDNFNKILNTLDTSLPTANANDSVDGFVAVLSPTVEIRGYANDGRTDLKAVQIQTRYPDAMPPESVIAFRAFVAATEGTSDLKVADDILNALNFIPEFDKNEDDKIFPATTVTTNTMVYETHFVKDNIDELTLIVRPRVEIPQ